MQPITIDFSRLLNRFRPSSLPAKPDYAKADFGRRVKPVEFFEGEMVPGADEYISSFYNYSNVELARLAMTNPWIYSNIKLISDSISQGIIQIEERDDDSETGWEVVPRHDFTKIVEGRPNPYMGQAFSWRYVVQWLMLWGEGYWLLFPNRSGELAQMYPLPSDRVKPIPSGKQVFAGFVYQPISGGDWLPIPTEQICFHRLPNPFDYHRGLSPLSAYLISLYLDQAARKYDLDDYKNGLTLRHLISLRPEISNGDFARFRSELREGQRKGERFLTVRGGEVDLKTLTATAEGQKAIRDMTEKEANLIYGIPPGLRDMSAYKSNAQTANDAFLNYTIWPLMTLLAEDLSAQIVSRWYDEGDEYRAVFEDVRPVNILNNIKERDSQRVTMTYDEARAADGRPPHPDPDVGAAPSDMAGQIYKLKIEAGLTAGSEPDPSMEDQSDGMIIDSEPADVEESPNDSPADPEADLEEAQELEKSLARLYAGDMKRWKAKAVRHYAESGSGLCDFTSDYIPAHIIEAIRQKLALASTSDAVKSAFSDAAAFVPKDADSFVPAIESADQIASRIRAHPRSGTNAEWAALLHPTNEGESG